MKKLHSLAIYALVTPAIMLSSSAVFSQQSGHDVDDSQLGSRAEQSASQSSTGHRNMPGEQSNMEHRGFMDSAPASGMHASTLIGAEVTTSGDEGVGSVDDLIINDDGQIVAIVVGVGGFLGMGQKDVAIGWDDVTRSGDSDDQELRIESTREELRDAPEFESEE